MKKITKKLIQENNTDDILRLTKSQLEVILKNAGDAITAQDATGKFIFANDLAAKMSGYGAVEEMLSAPPLEYLNIFDIADEYGQPFPPEKMPGRRALAGEKDTQVLLRLTNKMTNEILWVNVKSTAIFDNNNEPYLVINTIQDVTEHKLAEQAKTDFLSLASHELRTPLSSLTLFIGILQKDLAEAETKPKYYLERIQEQAQRLIQLTNDLLDITRLDTGKLGLKKTNFYLDELIRKTVEEMQMITIKHTITITNHPSVIVFCDKYRIYQVLINFLSNAIKYSPSRGEITVSLEKKSREAIVSVQDQGIGITKLQQRKIFTRMYQVNDPNHKLFAGLGLGLYISKEIIERHNGRIWVESEKDKGSTFFFSLPNPE